MTHPTTPRPLELFLKFTVLYDKKAENLYWPLDLSRVLRILMITTKCIFPDDDDNKRVLYIGMMGFSFPKYPANTFRRVRRKHLLKGQKLELLPFQHFDLNKTFHCEVDVFDTLVF